MSSYWHNKGQRDGARGRGYNPPHGIFDSLTTWTRSGNDKNARENGAYKDGRRKGERDRNR